MYLNVDGFSLPHGLGFGLASSNNKKNNKNHGSSSSSSGITGCRVLPAVPPRGKVRRARLAVGVQHLRKLARSRNLPSSSSGGAGTFRPVAVEAWAVGGEAVVSAALEARGVVRAVAEAQRRKNGTVDKRQFLGDLDGAPPREDLRWRRRRRA